MATRGRPRKERAPQALEVRSCKHCGKRIYPGRNRKRLFCNNACKQAYYRARKVAGVTLIVT